MNLFEYIMAYLQTLENTSYSDNFTSSPAYSKNCSCWSGMNGIRAKRQPAEVLASLVLVVVLGFLFGLVFLLGLGIFLWFYLLFVGGLLLLFLFCFFLKSGLDPIA